jgi:hypothetical protein
MQGDGGEDGQQVGEAGRDISSTPSGDVEMLEEQDQHDDAWKEKVAEFIAEKYLLLTIVESTVFREMIGALNTKAQIPAATGIKRTMENM